MIPTWITPGIRRRHASSLASLHPLLSLSYERLLHVSSLHAWDADPFLYCLCGYRNEPSQRAAYKSGHTSARWLESWHNVRPALAMDLVPVWSDNPTSIEWSSERTKTYLTYLADSIADVLTWGGSFVSRPGDIFHFQLFPKNRKPSEFLSSSA